MGGIGNSNYHISPPSRRKFPRMLAILGSCLLLVIHLPTSLGEPACEMKFSVPLEGSIDDDLNFVTNDGLVYKSGDYWLHRRTYRGCICTVKPCLQKCCRNGFVTNDKMSCVPENSTTPNMDQLLPGFDFFIEGDDKKLELVKDLPTNHSHVILPENQNFTCEAYELNEKEKEGFKVLKDGRMKIPPPEDVPNGETYYGWDEFCMEVNSQTGKLMPYVCFPPENVRKESLNIYPYFLILSVFFLILTLIVYILLPPLRNNPAKCMMNLVVSLIIGYSFLAQQQIYRKPLPRKLCRFVAYTIYFFLMASYFWLNVMCYDIYSAFKTMKSVARSRTKKRNVMIAHCFYAWGSPFVMMVIAYFVDMYGPDYIIKPRLAVTSCWFGQTSSLYLYFYGPMMILLFANIFFFSVTIYKLYQVSKQTEVLKNTESNRHHQKEKDRCFLYGKLFVVMGVTWIMEVVSERIGGQEFWWYPTDIINICQGIGIFVIFVLKRRVLYMLNQKFCPSLNLIKESESPSSKPTSSSTGSTSQNGIAMNGATLNGNGNATNGNARREAPGNVYVGEEGYENPIPMTPLAERNNGDASIPIDDTDTRRRY